MARAADSVILLARRPRRYLEGAGVKIYETPAKVVWFKGKVNPKDVLAVLDTASVAGNA